MKILIVGAGMFGAVCARELFEAGHDVMVVDSRPHIGGNCYTEHDKESGAHVHVYGPHIFHTDNPRVWAYARRFTDFNTFKNMPLAHIGGRLFQLPINLMTLHQLYGPRVSCPGDAIAWLDAVRVSNPRPANMEEACLARMGRELYEMFFEGYTEKQWGMHPRQLPPAIASRLPLRTNFDSNYYTHHFQGIPTEGYTAMFARMLSGIKVELGVPAVNQSSPLLRLYDRVIFSGAIDEFFDYKLGTLEYRSLRFETESVQTPDWQGNAVINYPSRNVDFTRIVEHKHFTPGLNTPSTVITCEFPEDWQPGRTRFYPIGTPANERRAADYAGLAALQAPSITFGGRLGSYRYMDMDKTIEAALTTVRAITGAPT